jgi:molybdate transport system substrate-binding protein
MHSRALRFVLGLALAGAGPAASDEVSVFAAASLTEAVKEAAKGFQAAAGHQVSFNFGASNDLARQIRAGAPADLFFSADLAQMQALEKDGRVSPIDRIDALSNALAVVVPSDSKARVAAAADLRGLGKIALANPEAVPAGVYAQQYLRAEGAWDALKGKVVPTLDVRAALAAVEAGHVDAGIVYRTDAALSKRVRVAFEVPRERGPKIVYPLSLVAGAKPAAAQLRDYLVSDAARTVYEKHGFVVILDE